MSYTALYDHPIHGVLAHQAPDAMPKIGAIVEFRQKQNGTVYQVRGRVERIVPNHVVLLEDCDVEIVPDGD
jgi:hypothetical protein